MLLLLAGYGLAAAAFYLYISKTAAPDPYQDDFTPNWTPEAGSASAPREVPSPQSELGPPRLAVRRYAAPAPTNRR
jgi:hypothetical protein